MGCDGREGADRESLAMDEDDARDLQHAIAEAEAAGGKVILVINSTGPIDLNDYESRVQAILCPFFSGIQGGKVTADVYKRQAPCGLAEGSRLILCVQRLSN